MWFSRYQISVAWNYQLHQSLFAIERVLEWRVFLETKGQDKRVSSENFSVAIFDIWSRSFWWNWAGCQGDVLPVFFDDGFLSVWHRSVFWFHLMVTSKTLQGSFDTYLIFVALLVVSTLRRFVTSGSKLYQRSLLKRLCYLFLQDAENTMESTKRLLADVLPIDSQSNIESFGNYSKFKLQIPNKMFF